MNCAECTEQLVPHLEGLLDQSQQRQLKSHLDDCPTCRDELDRMRRLFDRLVRRGRAASDVSPDLQWTDQLILKQTSRQRRNMMKRIARIAVAAVLLIGAFVGILQFFGGSNDIASLAEAAEQLRQAKTVTWTMLAYQNVTSKDKKTIWLETESVKYMWKAPGLQREVHINAQGRVHFIRIENHMKGASLSLEPGKKKARLTYPGLPMERTGQQSKDVLTRMSEWLTKTENGWIMGEPKPLGTKEINGREAIGYRVARETVGFGKGTGSRSVPWSADLWLDAEAKRLVLVHNPGVNVYDPEKDPARHNRPGEGWSGMRVMGGVFRDIVYNQELDDSLFSLDPPDGYDVTKAGTPEPAEKDMVEWLGIRAECNGGVFPDDPGPLRREAVQRILDKFHQGEKLSPAEQKVFDQLYAVDRYYPVQRFVAVTAGNSWHYTGKGVKLGDKTAIVCRYKPKDSKTYRMVYGDLSVKDVAPEDVPSQAEP
ncbi:MAG: zf-HC2 domain-containing protein [Planctomycetota bacterium]|jgi:hypothetical protein